VQENALTATTTASAGISLRVSSKSSNSQPTKKAKADVMIPLAISGSARPRKSGSRFAGVASSCESVCVHRSPPTVIAIP
jgi:hypothetical protein